MAELVIPAATWAAFPHRNDSSSGVQNYQQQIVLDWLPTSGYEFAYAPDIEVNDADGGMETWIPVIPKA